MGTPVFVYDRVAVDESQVANAPLSFRNSSQIGGGLGVSSRKAYATHVRKLSTYTYITLRALLVVIVIAKSFREALRPRWKKVTVANSYVVMEGRMLSQRLPDRPYQRCDSRCHILLARLEQSAVTPGDDLYSVLFPEAVSSTRARLPGPHPRL